VKRCTSCGQSKPSKQFAFPHGKPSGLCKSCYGQAGGEGWPAARQTKEMREYHDAMAAQYRQRQTAHAALMQRGAHELARQKRIELRRERRKDLLAIAWYLTVNVGRAMVAFGQMLPRPVLAGVGLLGGVGLGVGIFAWLF